MVLRVQPLNHSGGESEEDPPVPIPNTEVKLLSVEDTWRETARKNRLLPLYMLKASQKGAFFVLSFLKLFRRERVFRGRPKTKRLYNPMKKFEIFCYFL